MPFPQKQNNEISSLFNQKDFVDSTIAQLNKDLQGLFFTELTNNFNSDSPIIEQLISTLQPILQELSKKQPEQLSQFIYRVDLGEKKYLDSFSRDLSLTDLAFLVIEREAQKVYLRAKFK